MAIRLFERSEETNPSNLNDRLAYGRPGVPTRNITLSNFVAWISNSITALRPSNNLSDVDNTATSRSNLGVYSTTETDNLLGDKADSSDVYTTTETDSEIASQISNREGRIVYMATRLDNGSITTIISDGTIVTGGSLDGKDYKLTGNFTNCHVLLQNIDGLNADGWPTVNFGSTEIVYNFSDTSSNAQNRKHQIIIFKK